LCRSGDLSQGIAVLKQAIDDLEAVEFCLSLPGHMAVLADAMRLEGRYAEAVDLCERAMKIAAKSNARLYEPEIKRVRAIVARDERGNVDKEVHQMLRSAASCARDLQLPVLEFRALQTMLECVGEGRLDVRAKRRLEQLSYLRGFEERAARFISSAYPSAN